MTVHKLIFLILLLPFLSVGQEDEQLLHFSKLHVSTGVEVSMKSAIRSSMSVTVENGTRSDVITSLVNGELTIRLRSNTGSSVKAKVDLYYEVLPSLIKVSTGGRVSSKESISTPAIVLEGASGGFIDLELDADLVDVDISSGSIVTLSGQAFKQTSEVSSGAQLRAFKLTCKDIATDCTSGGRVQIHASESLDAISSLGGAIYYAGTPRVTKEESSSGFVQPRKD